VAHVACGDGVRLVASGRALPFDFETPLSAESSEDFADLWHYLGLPDPVPVVDFRTEYVVAWVTKDGWIGYPVMRVCRDGRLELAFSSPSWLYLGTTPEPYTTRVFAMSRRRLAGALEGASSDEASSSPLVSCDAEVNHSEIRRRQLARREAMQRSAWIEGFDWQAAGGLIGGVSPSRGGLVGGELRAGLRNDIDLGDGDGFVGDLIGVDLRARWLVDPGAARPNFVTVGLWPWMMMSHDWVFHRSFSRAPTFMSLVAPKVASC
jgi:hypothetical protein